MLQDGEHRPPELVEVVVVEVPLDVVPLEVVEVEVVGEVVEEVVEDDVAVEPVPVPVLLAPLPLAVAIDWLEPEVTVAWVLPLPVTEVNVAAPLAPPLRMQRLARQVNPAQQSEGRMQVCAEPPQPPASGTPGCFEHPASASIPATAMVRARAVFIWGPS